METLSLELASRIYDIAGAVFVISLLVGVVTTILVIWTGKIKERYWDKERGASNERIAELGKETAGANERTKEAELALAKFRAPRQLTDEQRRQIIEQASKFPGTAFNLSGMGNEQIFFALDIGDTLTKAGWVIQTWPGFGMIPANRNFIVGAIPTWGVAIRINDLQESTAGHALIDILKLVGVEGVSLENTTAPEGAAMRHVINIMVGDKR